MPTFNTISGEKLIRLIGTPNCPVIIDVRENPSLLLPSALLIQERAMAERAEELAGRDVVVVCDDGRSRSAGVAAVLRSRGCRAETLEGGYAGWSEAGLPLIAASTLPKRDEAGRTMWVTRARPKVDRIACPWLVRRFVDPGAAILYVPPPDVLAVAERLGATPFDIEGAAYSDRDERCSFEAMIDGLGLGSFPALVPMALIVRGADTAQPDVAPQAAGLLAMSLGLSRMYANDLEQLDAGMVLYDALYRWCRDAAEETHDPTSHRPRRA